MLTNSSLYHKINKLVVEDQQYQSFITIVFTLWM
jgi:hypothetical protein